MNVSKGPMRGVKLFATVLFSFGFAVAATNQSSMANATMTQRSATSTVVAKTKIKSKATANPSALQSTKLSTVKQYQQPKAQYLFILQASTAKITRDKGSFILTLKDIDPDLLFFTDRPIRKTGLLDTATFLEAWAPKNSAFQQDPPHVALIYGELPEDKNSVRDGIDIKLLNPVALGHRSYSFNLTDLDGTVEPGTFHQVSLIIDYRIYN